MKNLRITEADLRAVFARREASRVRTHVFKDQVEPKLVVKILLSDVESAGLSEPVQEHQFHPVRKWRFDLAWIADKVALEIEGGIWIRGRHNRGAGMEADMEKYNEAQMMGWTVLRYSTEQIKNGRSIADLKRVLNP